MVHAFARALKLSFSEHRYFEALVGSEQSTQDEDRRYYKQVLKDIKKQVGNGPTPSAPPQLLGQWYYPAALIALEGTSSSKAEKRLKTLVGLNKVQSQSAINDFLSMGLVEEVSGRYKMSDRYLSYYDKASTKKTHRNFLEQQLTLSQRKLQSDYNKGAKFFSHTFSSSPEAVQKYVDKVDRTLDEIAEESDQDSIDQIYQLNIQLFSV